MNKLPYALHFLSILAIVSVGTTLWPQRRHRAVFSFLVFLGLQIWWIALFTVEIAVPDLNSKVFFSDLQFPALCLLPVAWFQIVLNYLGFTGKRRTILGLTLIIPVITLVLIATNSAHHLFRIKPTLITDGPFPVLNNAYGPWFYAVTVPYRYALFTASGIILIRHLLKSNLLQRGQVLAMLSALVLPAIIDITYVAGFSIIPGYAFTAGSAALTAILTAHAIKKYKIFNLTRWPESWPMKAFRHRLWYSTGMASYLTETQPARYCTTSQHGTYTEAA